MPSDSQGLSLIPVLVWTTVSQGAASAAVLATPILAPLLFESLAFSSASLGYLVSAAYVGAMASSMVGGRVVGRWGGCRALQLSLGASALGSFALAYGTVPTICVGMLCVGVGYGLSNPSGMHLLSRVRMRHRHNLVYSLRQAGIPIGGVCAGMVLPLLGEARGHEFALFAVGATLVGILAVLQVRRSRWDDDRNRHEPVFVRPSWRFQSMWPDERPLQRLAVYSFLMAGIQLSIVSYVVTLSVEALSVSPVDAGRLLALLQTTAVLGRVAWGAVADRIGRGLVLLRYVAFLSASSLMCLCAATATKSVAGLVGCVVVIGATSVGWNGLFMGQVAVHAAPGTVGRATGLILAYNYAGVLFGPTAFAATRSMSGSYVIPVMFTAGVAGVAGLVMLMRSPSVSSSELA